MGTALLKVHHRVKAGQNAGLINNAIKRKSNILILGSSRARHTYNDKFLSDKLRKKVYNAGNDGMGILYATGLLSLVVKYQKPELIILELSSFGHKERTAARILMPYFGQSPELDNILADSWENRLLLHSRLYRLNGIFLSVLKNYFKRGPAWGFFPLNETYRENPELEKSGPLSSKIRDYYFTFFNLVKKHNIKLLVVNSPSLNDVRKNNLSEFIADYCNKNKIKYLPFYSYKYKHFQNISLFKDQIHLNKKGTKLFNPLFLEKFLEYFPEYRK